MKPRFKTPFLAPSLSVICLSLSLAGTHSLQAQTTITSNNTAAYTESAVSSTAASSVLTVADGTKYAVGDVMRFTGQLNTNNPFTTGNGPSGTLYYVVSVIGNTVQVATSAGGTPLDAVATTSATTTQLSQNLSLGSNWTGGVAPNSNSQIANFNGPGANVPAFIVTGPTTLYGITHAGSGSDLVLASGANGTGYHALTFATNDATTPKISSNSSVRIVTFGLSNAKLAVGGTQGLNFNGRLGGALTGAGTAATSTDPLKNIRLVNVDWSGFSGGYTVERGELNINNALGALKANEALTVGNAQTTTNNTLAHLAMNTFGATVNGLNGTSLGRISGASTLSVGNGDGSGDYAGVIGRGMLATETATNLTKNGTGTQTISGIMVGTGAVVVNNGTLALGGVNTYTGTTTVNTGSTLSLTGSLTGGGAISVNGTGVISQSAAGVISGASAITLSGTGTSTLSGANTYSGLTTINNGTTLKLGSATSLGASGAAGTETALNSGGTLDLNGQAIAESFSSNAGTIINSNTMAAGVITNEMVDLSNATFDGAGDITVSNIRRTNGVTRRITKDGTGTLTLGGDVSNNRYGLTVNAGNVILAKTADGVEAVSRFNLIMNGGTVKLTLSSNQINDSTDIIHQLNAGTLDLNGFDEGLSAVEGAAGIITNSTGTTSTLTLGHSNSTTGYNGNLGGTITGNLNLTKTGSNAQTLSGTNTYSGATTVSGGELEITGTGSVNNSSGVTVGSGATFRYNSSTDLTTGLTLNSGSTVTGTNLSNVDITIGLDVTLSPGNSPGTMSTGNLTWLNGGNYNWQVLDVAGIAGTGYDTTAVTGTLELGSLTTNGFAINLWTLASIGPDVSGEALNFNDTSNYSWKLVSTTGGVTGFNAADFSIFTVANNGTGSFDNAFTGTFNVSADANNLYLNYVAVVPEPSAALLGGLGLIALLRRRRA